MAESASASAGKYADYSREQLLAEINRLKKTKKYGLVWEHKTEQVIEDFKNGKQPYLEEVEDKRIENAPGEPTNLIIEGDNFDALSVLNYTHAGKIDVIYIDPPYNTGNKDFIYNDNYVDSEDAFRHSKWLSFMEPRLKLAKNLLAEDGVIFISIDDNEGFQLKLLCDEVFGGDSFISDIVCNSRKSVSNDAIVSLNHNYTLVYARLFEKFNCSKSTFKLKDSGVGFSNPDNDPRGDWKADPFDSPGIRPNLTYPIKNPNNGKIFLPPNGRCWRTGPSEYEEYLKDGRIIFGKTGNGKPQLKRYLSDAQNKGVTPKSLWDDCGTATDGTREIQDVFGAKIFDTPKPTQFLKKIINLSSRRNSIILDFFAGSGTTGPAVLELNKEDGGHRQFILCTNNGDKGPDSTKIAEDITYPRIKTVITGKRQDGSKYSDGIPANLRYYKINHLEKKQSLDAYRQLLVDKMEETLQIKENAFEQVEIADDFALYQNAEKYLGLVYDPFALDEIIEKLEEVNTEKKDVALYVFSYSRDAFSEDYDADFYIEFKAMPEGLLKTYQNILEELRKEEK